MAALLLKGFRGRNGPQRGSSLAIWSAANGAIDGCQLERLLILDLATLRSREALARTVIRHYLSSMRSHPRKRIDISLVDSMRRLNSIQLLKLLCAISLKCPFVCKVLLELNGRSRHSRPTYEALSYCWGDPADPSWRREGGQGWHA